MTAMPTDSPTTFGLTACTPSRNISPQAPSVCNNPLPTLCYFPFVRLGSVLSHDLFGHRHRLVPAHREHQPQLYLHLPVRHVHIPHTYTNVTPPSTQGSSAFASLSQCFRFSAIFTTPSSQMDLAAPSTPTPNTPTMASYTGYETFPKPPPRVLPLTTFGKSKPGFEGT